MALTEREKHLNKCLKDLSAYCKEHKDTCEGCIFYNQVQIDSLIMASCRLLYDIVGMKDD